MTSERKMIATARNSRRYWDSEAGTFAAINDPTLFAFRWLRALRKVKRRRGSAEKIIADTYLSHLTDYMLWVAREISDVDQMPWQQAYDRCQVLQRQWAGERAR